MQRFQKKGILRVGSFENVGLSSEKQVCLFDKDDDRRIVKKCRGGDKKMKPGARRKGQNTVKDAITEAAKTAQKEAGKTVDKAEAAEAKIKAEEEAKAAEAKAKAEKEAKAAAEQAKHQEELEEQEYQRRFAKHRDELKWLYMEVYQNDWMFEELCEQMHRLYKERRKGLKTLDRQREADPEWYKKNDMMGMMLYVDNFAGNLKGV